jgi:hypothetical protein
MLYQGLLFQSFLFWQWVAVEHAIYMIKVQKEIFYSIYPELRISSE